LTNIDSEFYCYSNELHSHLPFDRLWFELLCAQYTLRTKIINWPFARYVTPAMLVVYTQAKISHLVASLPTSRQQVVFALLVPSCQQVWNKLLTVVTILLILSDMLQGCSHKTTSTQSWYITILLQSCVVNIVAFLLGNDCIRLHLSVLEQPCNKSNNAMKLVKEF
jgi:hypothetical protein